MMRLPVGLLSLAVFVLAAAAASSQTMTQTLPAGLELVDGNGTTNFPFNVADDQIWQWHYDSAQFAATGPIEITEISVRASVPFQPVPAFSVPNVEVKLITASTDYAVGGHDPVFANNVLSSTTVKNGTFSSAAVPGGGFTANWIPMGLTGSHVYDPTLGHDFIIQIRTCTFGTLWGVGLDSFSGAPLTVGGNRYGSTTNCNAGTMAFNNNEFVPIVQITYHPVSSLAQDVGVNAIVQPQNSPDSCTPLSSSSAVIVSVKNFGTAAIPAGTSIAMSYTIDSGTPVVDNLVLAAALNPNASTFFSFAVPVNLSAPGPHDVSASTALVGDANSANDAAMTTVYSGGGSIVTTFPFFEDFDGFGATSGSTSPPPGWEQDLLDGGGSGLDVDWYFLDGPSSTPGTGPAADHSTGQPGLGFYAMLEDSDAQHPAVNLLTPCLDLTGLSNPHLRFWVHSQDALGPNSIHENFLSVDVISFPGSVVTLDVAGPIGHLGSTWQLEYVDLSAFSGQKIRVRFRGNMTGGGVTHDIAIDDVAVFQPVVTAGQAPRPGLSVFDINDSVNDNGLPVSFGQGGVYRAEASLSGTFSMHFEGIANRAIILLSGPESVARLSFPLYGQLDIGGPTDPMTGFPGQLVVLADGTLGTLPNSLFVTDGTGSTTIAFPTPGYLPLGHFTTFQAILLTGGPSVLAISNAVDLVVVP